MSRGEERGKNMEQRGEKQTKKNKKKKRKKRDRAKRTAGFLTPKNPPHHFFFSLSLSFLWGNLGRKQTKTAERAHTGSRGERKKEKKLPLLLFLTWPWPPTAASSRAAAWSACAPSRPPSPRAPPSPTASAPRGTGSTCTARCDRARGRSGGAA